MSKPTKKKPRTPKLCRHSTSGQGYVTLSGRRIYLGRHGRPETEQAYHRVVADWIANGRRLPDPAPDDFRFELVEGVVFRWVGHTGRLLSQIEISQDILY